VVKSVENSSMTVNRIAPPFPVSDTGQPWPSPIVVNFEVVERVVEADLQIDSNNDGNISDADDSIEQFSPGAIIQLTNDLGDPEYKQLNIKISPSSVEGSLLKIRASEGQEHIQLSASQGGSPLSLPHTFSDSDTFPKVLYVKGLSLGSSKLELLTTFGGSETVVDEVAVEIVEPISWTPLVKKAAIWEPARWDDTIIGAISGAGADYFHGILEKQGYIVDRHSDTTYGDSNVHGVTMANLKSLKDAGVVAIEAHGNEEYIEVVYTATEEEAEQWVGSSNLIYFDIYKRRENSWAVSVKDSWFRENLKEGLDANKALVFLNSCISNGGSLPTDVGGRTVFGWSGVCPNNSIHHAGSILNSMSNEKDYRTAKKAHDRIASVAPNYKINGNGYTALAPSPLKQYGEIEGGTGLGSIVFDSYMDSSRSASSAIVIQSGSGSLSSVNWGGNSTGKFSLHAQINGEGASGTLKAEADNCQSYSPNDNGGKKMDGDHARPNGDDTTWTY